MNISINIIVLPSIAAASIQLFILIRACLNALPLKISHPCGRWLWIE